MPENTDCRYIYIYIYIYQQTVDISAINVKPRQRSVGIQCTLLCAGETAENLQPSTFLPLKVKLSLTQTEAKEDNAMDMPSDDSDHEDENDDASDPDYEPSSDDQTDDEIEDRE